jgi:hypothetical protein
MVVTELHKQALGLSEEVVVAAAVAVDPERPEPVL